MAAHDETAKTELKRQIETIRTVQAEAIAQHFRQNGLRPTVPPLAITMILSAVARQLANERSFGVALGHDETIQVMEDFLAGFAEPHPAPDRD